MKSFSLSSLASGRKDRAPKRSPSSGRRKKRSAFLGVDVGTHRLHLLEFGGGSRVRVNGYGGAAVPDGAVVDDRIADVDAVGSAVKQALRKSGIDSRNAAIAMSGPSVISKTIQLPAVLGDAEIEEQIHHDADSYIPHPIEEVHLDFRVIGADPNNPSVNRIMLAACRRDAVASYVEALRKGGLGVEIVDLASTALENACSLLVDAGQPTAGSANYAVFNVGTDQTRLTVQRDGKSVYTRELALATQPLIDSLVTAYEVVDQNELFERIVAGSIDATMIADQLAAFASNAAAQIEQALQFFTSAAAFDEAIDTVVITGSIGLLPGSEEALREHLDRELQLGNPIATMPASSAAKKNRVEWNGPALAVASGLAIRSVR